MFSKLDFRPQRWVLIGPRAGLFSAVLVVGALLGQAGWAQDAKIDPAADRVPDPVSDPLSNPEPVALPVLCADADLTPEACLDLLGGLSLERYCKDKGVGSAACPGYVAAFKLPANCTQSNLSLLGCTTELSRVLQNRHEQSRNLLRDNRELRAQLAGLPAPEPDQSADLQVEIDSLTAAKTALEDQVTALTAQVDELTDEASILAEELAAAQAAVTAGQVSVADVCRAAAGRLDARAQEALGTDAPVLDQPACAENPIAEIARFVALLPADAICVAKDGAETCP